MEGLFGQMQMQMYAGEEGGQKMSRLSNVAEKLAPLRPGQKNFGNPLRPSHCDVRLCCSKKVPRIVQGWGKG